MEGYLLLILFNELNDFVFVCNKIGGNVIVVMINKVIYGFVKVNLLVVF